jgi:predicted glycogen debranching enzyme
MNPIRFNGSSCAELAKAIRLEWLETNGIGGFASSTMIGLNSRRYHGLLTAATKPPGGRIVMLSKIEETLLVGGRRHDLSVNQYPGAVHPRGHLAQVEFKLEPFPTFVYQVDGLEIEKRVFQVYGENTTVVEYELRAVDVDPPPPVQLELRPLIAFRDYHSTTHRNDALNPFFEQAGGCVVVKPYAGLPALRLAHDAAAVEAVGDWYLNFEYALERERGLDFREDLFCPLVLRYDLSRRSSAAVIASLESHQSSDAAGLRESEIARRRALVESAPLDDPLVKALTLAADQFIVSRGHLKTIIAGYPWFTDWGRDTMIALPGLTLVTGRYEDARGILSAFANSIDRGMLPNRFPDQGEQPEYNTVDATLWYFEAVRAYLEYTGDEAFVREKLYSILKDILNWHFRGTRYGIRVDSDGLLRCGEAGVQLTWMDAKIGDRVVTPRHGKPVEIQALWHNAIRIMEDLSERFGDRPAATFLREFAQLTRQSFLAKFWNEAAGCLYDVVDGENRDAAIRPNQILAASLQHSMLDASAMRSVVDVVERLLLTPVGLRSLAPGDPQYRARYEGGVFERDSAYHQGTVWPWLLGPFLTAYIKSREGSAEARQQAAEWLSGFERHFEEGCLGQVSEIADGDAPHTPRGCFAQAWSVSELLRAAVEDVHGRFRNNEALLGILSA